MPTINRSALIGGGAKNVYNGATFYNRDPFVVKVQRETYDISPDALGRVDRRSKDMLITGNPTPEGRLNAAIISALWPYTNTLEGALVVGNTDTPWLIHASDTELHTVECAIVKQMPKMMFSTQKTLIEAIELEGILANNAAWSAAAARYAITPAGATFADSGWTGPSMIKTQPYTLAYGSVTGLSASDCEDGFTFEPTAELQPVSTDALGRVVYRFISAKAVVRCKPIGATASNLLAAMNVQGGSVARGQSLTTDGQELSITGADGVKYLDIANATLDTTNYRFSAKEMRNGEVAFEANRTFSGGAQQPLFVLAAS